MPKVNLYQIPTEYLTKENEAMQTQQQAQLDPEKVTLIEVTVIDNNPENWQDWRILQHKVEFTTGFGLQEFIAQKRVDFKVPNAKIFIRVIGTFEKPKPDSDKELKALFAKWLKEQTKK